MAVQDQIDQSNAKADAAQALAITYAERAQMASRGYATPGTPTVVTAPVITLPPFTPNTALGANFLTDFNATWTSFETGIQTAMGGWMGAYFPVLNPALPTSEDTWLLNVINNGYSGIPVAVEQAIWSRAHAKETIESLRMEEEATAQFAARGFSLPPGVLANRLLQVQQEAANKASTVARDLAIKQMEIAADMVKLAITEVVKLRMGVAAALADFMRAWLSMPTAAAEVAKAKAQMEQYLWQATSDYMRAQVSVAQVSLDAQKANSSTNTEYARMTIDAWFKSLENQVRASVGAAEQLGRVAASSRGAQSTLVGSIETANKA